MRKVLMNMSSEDTTNEKYRTCSKVQLGLITLIGSLIFGSLNMMGTLSETRKNGEHEVARIINLHEYIKNNPSFSFSKSEAYCTRHTPGSYYKGRNYGIAIANLTPEEYTCSSYDCTFYFKEKGEQESYTIMYQKSCPPDNGKVKCKTLDDLIHEFDTRKNANQKVRIVVEEPPRVAYFGLHAICE